MKVLVIPSWYPSKSNLLNGVFFKEQVEALYNLGIDVTVLNINLASISSIRKVKIGNKLLYSNEAGIKVYRYEGVNFFPKMEKLYINYYGKLLRKYIDEIQNVHGKFDLVHIHSAFDAGMAYGNMKDRIPYIITEHSSRYGRNMINNTEKILLKNAFENAEQVVAVGSGLAKEIRKYSEKIEVKIIPNMVNISNKEISMDRSKKRFRFFSLAFLNKYKGMDILIEAFNQKSKEFNDCELYIGGYGSEFYNLENQIKELGLEDQIKLLGALNREEVDFHMKNCDCFVLASRVETFGVVFIEAMAQGKPVIGTKTGGPDTFINEKVGKVVEIDDVNKLSDAMHDIYLNKNNYSSKYIKEYCKDTFSREVVTEKNIDIYRQIINEEDTCL